MLRRTQDMYVRAYVYEFLDFEMTTNALGLG